MGERSGSAEMRRKEKKKAWDYSDLHLPFPVPASLSFTYDTMNNTEVDLGLPAGGRRETPKGYGLKDSESSR